MAPSSPRQPSLESFVEYMFDMVFEAAERAELLTWIRAWEDAHPDVDNAHRITGWIDVAYAFQSGADMAEVIRQSTLPQDRFAWLWAPAFT